MSFETPSGARFLLSSAMGYVRGKYQRMAFLDDAIEQAAMRVAKDYDGLEPSVFPVVFEKEEVEDLIEGFDAGGDRITVAAVAGTMDTEMLDPDLNADPEELVAKFFEYLEQEISQDPEIGRKLQTVYAQQLYEYATRLSEGQEEILDRIEVYGKDRHEKGYDVFQTVDDRFELQLAGEHPRQRFDLPFYGREEEISEVVDFVESSSDMLVVHGPAGIGKTRLVVQAAFQLQATHPDWTVYTANVHADLDTGLSEIDFDEEDGVVLFVDDARDSDQLDRLFDIASRRRDHVKLVFTERSLFASALETAANRVALDPMMLQLPPLDSDLMSNLITDAYGIQKPQVVEWIIAVSEGKPLISHLLADQLISDGASDQSPVAAEDSVLERVFDDVVRDIQRAAEQQRIGDPQKLESYFRYVAAVGRLDTEHDAFMEAFRDTLSLGKEDEQRYRRVLLNAVGTVSQESGVLRVQPDALKEYVVYDTFFTSDAPRDYMETVYEGFGEFTEASQVNNLLVIENRYACQEAGRAVDEIVSTHSDRMGEYTAADRVRLLRRFERLGAASPPRAVELVEIALTEPYPAEDTESPGLQRRIVKAPSDVGNLYLAAISLLSPGVLQEPEEITDILLDIAVAEGVSPKVGETVFQHLRQMLRPGFTRSPVAQTKVIEHVADTLVDTRYGVAFRKELLDAVGAASSEQAEEFSMDPVNRSQGRLRQGPIRRAEEVQEFRLAAIDAIIRVVEEAEAHMLRVEAAGKLNRFVLAQKRYHGRQGEVFNRDELDRIYEFATAHVGQETDLDCLSKLHRLVDNAADGDLGIERLGQELAAALQGHDLYQLAVHMDPRDRDWEEAEAEIRAFVRELEPPWGEQFDRFVDVVEASPETSFNRFFKLFAEEHGNAGVQFLEDAPPGLVQYREQVIVGICVGKPGTGKDLIAEYIDTETYDLACAGLSVFFNSDRDFAVAQFERIMADEDQYSEDLLVQLGTVLRGEWDEDSDWAEDTFQTLLHGAEAVTPRVIDGLVNALPYRKDDLAAVDEAVLTDVLDAVGDFDRLDKPHRLQQLVTEVAERYPLVFVEFCIDRVHDDPSRLDQLPYHMEVSAERMRGGEEYEEAVRAARDIVLDSDEYSPQVYARLFHIIPLDDVAPLLIDEISDCSEDQLLRVIWYCELFALSDLVQDALIAVMTDGLDSLRDADAIERNIISAIASSPRGRVGGMTSNMHQEEIAILQTWQDDRNLPTQIRNFARKAERHLVDDVDARDRFEDDFFS